MLHNLLYPLAYKLKVPELPEVASTFMFLSLQETGIKTYPAEITLESVLVLHLATFAVINPDKFKVAVAPEVAPDVI